MKLLLVVALFWRMFAGVSGLSDEASSSLLPECSTDSADEEGELPNHCPHEVVVETSVCDDHLAISIAREHGFEYNGPVGSLKCHYSLTHKHNDRKRRDAMLGLETDPDVAWFQAQTIKKRVKRDFVAAPNYHTPQKRSPKTELKLPWTDPMYNDQWFLHSGASGGWDMKVREAWKLGVSGQGVSVSILDDGIQWNHPDLNQNYDKLASADINGKDDDPMPQDNGDNKHGTRCAGEVAAVAGNNWCGVGVAFNAGIGGVRMLDGPVSDRVEAASLSLNQDHIDIYSASWGPEDDGRTFDGPGPLAKKAFSQGIQHGRGGRGNIFVWASGNGGSHGDSCSCDGYTTSIYTLSVSSATFDNRRPWYLEECPSTIATTYSSANSGQPAIVTVDMPNSCTKSHTGTSASAPMAAGIIALALDANRNLTWRDMQHIVLRSANPTPVESNPGWQTNAVGRRVSNKFGYGIMDAEALVKLAKIWKPIPEQQSCSHEYKMGNPNPRPLSGRFKQNYTMEFTGCSNGQAVNYLEQVQAVITVKFSKRGDLKITLRAPSGTTSVLLPSRPNDMNRNGFHKWPYLSVQQWGENPKGTWTLTIENVGSEKNTGSFHDWSLILYGTRHPAQPGDPSHGEPPGPTPTATKQGTSTSEIEGNEGLSSKFSTAESVGSCHEECKGGCSEANSATACHECLHYSLHPSNRASVKCVEKCSEGQFADESAKRCKQCLRGCASCADGDNCLTCQPGYFLLLADHTHFHHRQCLQECPDGFLPHNSSRGQATCKVACPEHCLTCMSDGACRRCKAGFFSTDDGKCVVSCPTGTFENGVVQHCNHCPALCEQCSTAIECGKCESGTEWSDTQKVCVHKDSTGCGTGACAEGTFCDSSIDRCLHCHLSCRTCNGPKPDNCLTCLIDGGLPAAVNNKCSRCDDYSFYDFTISRCIDCDDACAGCRNKGPSNCVRCATGYQRTAKGLCLRCCAEGESLRSHQCVYCDSIDGMHGSSGHFVAIVVGLCLGAVVFFILVFVSLMCRDSDSGSSSRGANSKIPYKQVPIEYSLEEDGPLVKDMDNGDSGIRSSESEEEDNLFDTRLNLQR